MYGPDYNKSYEPVVTLTTLRTTLSVVSSLDLELEQMDLVTAFLNGDLHEDVYISVPEGLNSDSNKNKACKLRKSLYGLKQSPRQWYAKIHDFLVTKLSFKSSQNDPCFCVRHTGSGTLIIALNVDDLLIAGNSKSEIANIERELPRRFETKDLGPARVILRIEIKRNRNEMQLFISPSVCTKEILERFGMSDSKSLATPMDKSYHESVNLETSSAGDIPYLQAIGSLMYIMIATRPDIAYAFGKLSQHAENPNKLFWIAVKRVLRYINSTKEFGMLYN